MIALSWATPIPRDRASSAPVRALNFRASRRAIRHAMFRERWARTEGIVRAVGNAVREGPDRIDDDPANKPPVPRRPMIALSSGPPGGAAGGLQRPCTAGESARFGAPLAGAVSAIAARSARQSAPGRGPPPRH